MTLFIQNNTAIGGTGAVFPNEAEADLLRISNLDMEGLGEETQPAPSNLIEVTYDPQTTTGPCPDRLHELVNTDFTAVPDHPIDIIVMAVDETFTLADGSSINAFVGVSLTPNEEHNGIVFNPTGSVLVIYTITRPLSTCQKAEGSDEFDLDSPTSVTLYHELSHALRTATNSGLSLDAEELCDASPEERAAEEDENDMRDQLGIRRRDVANHCAAACGEPVPETNCCVVASIATGSQSAEVRALRGLREGLLRRSEVGHAFFDQLHYEYYAFSPQVCTAMGNNEPLVDWVRTFCVRPLVDSLSLIRDLLIEGTTVERTGERLESTLEGGLGDLSPELLEQALRIVRSGRVDPEMLPVRMPAIEHVEAGPHVRWGLLEPIEIYLQAARERVAGVPSGELGSRFAARVEEWAPGLPLADFWPSLSESEVERELAFLGECLLRSDDVRREFAQRLSAAEGVEAEVVQ